MPPAMLIRVPSCGLNACKTIQTLNLYGPAMPIIVPSCHLSACKTQYTRWIGAVPLGWSGYPHVASIHVMYTCPYACLMGPCLYVCLIGPLPVACCSPPYAARSQKQYTYMLGQQIPNRIQEKLDTLSRHAIIFALRTGSGLVASTQNICSARTGAGHKRVVAPL